MSVPASLPVVVASPQGLAAGKLRSHTDVTTPMPTEWLKLMLEEIQRRQDEARRAHEEEAKRRQERGADADARRPQTAA